MGWLLLGGAGVIWAACEALSAGALELEPDFLGARLVRADALLRLGRRAEARAELDAAGKRHGARGLAAPLSGYDSTILNFNRREWDRLSAAASGKK